MTNWQMLDQETRELAVQVLTQKQLRVFQHRLDAHSWGTIALALGISKATAREHYAAAIANLYDALNPEEAA